MLSLLPYKTWSKARGPPLALPFCHRSGNPSDCYQNQENIKGITIAGLETKLLQFADDNCCRIRLGLSVSLVWIA